MDVSGRRTVGNACKYLNTVGLSPGDTGCTLPTQSVACVYQCQNLY